MIKYHGTPITPKKVFSDALKGRNSLVSFANQQDIVRSFEVCDKVLLDNGAFTFWSKGTPKVDWSDYYEWISKYDEKEGFFIPDVIDGSEKENDLLIEKCNVKGGIPVWHYNESIFRLEEMSKSFDYIALGSSREISHCGTKEARLKWKVKTELVMRALCHDDGSPHTKIHMLRCLDGRVFSKYPFYSGDSTNVAQNHHLHNTIKRDDEKGISCSYDGWKKIMAKIESKDSPKKYKFKDN